MSMKAIKLGGRDVNWDLEDVRRCSDHAKRQTRKTASTIRSLKRLIHRAERLQGKIACLIGE
jgi:hypothetical protein